MVLHYRSPASNSHAEIFARVLSWISMTTIKLEEHEKTF